MQTVHHRRFNALNGFEYFDHTVRGTVLTGPVAIRNGQAQWAKEKLWNTATDYYFEAIYENEGSLLSPAGREAASHSKAPMAGCG